MSLFDRRKGVAWGREVVVQMEGGSGSRFVTKGVDRDSTTTCKKGGKER